MGDGQEADKAGKGVQKASDGENRANRAGPRAGRRQMASGCGPVGCVGVEGVCVCVCVCVCVLVGGWV